MKKLQGNEKEFFKTEFGAELETVVIALEQNLRARRMAGLGTPLQREASRNINELMARLEVYEQGIRTFYGINLNFTRTDEYVGMCTEDESYYLIKKQQAEIEG